jgi:protein-tyrosine phosphatase
MIDIHSHILPSVDDGSKSWDTTVTMCEQALKDGVTHIVATPHANFRYSYDRERHEDLVKDLRAKVPQLEFSLGCDFHLSSENVEDAIKYPRRYTISDSRYLLVEYSDYITRTSAPEPVRRLLGAGLVPIVTHPERNPLLMRHPEIVETLVRLGCLVQITANSLTGFWGSTSRKVGLQLIKDRLAHFIASDAHDTRRRTTVLSEGLKAAAGVLGSAEANKLVLDNPAKIVRQVLSGAP